MYLAEGGIFGAITLWLCTLLFWLIALWAYKRKTPMNFWAGVEVAPEKLTNVAAYNRENAIMWAIFGTGFFVSGVVTLFHVLAGGILIAIICIPGIGFLFWNYKRIYNKYKA